MKKKALVMVSIIMISIITGYIILESGISVNPDDPEEKIDSDGDGVIDIRDAFPYDPAASLDTDGDGYPDYWNPGKNQSDSNTNLTIDAFLNDPAASIDSDNDGYPDCWNQGKDQGDSTSIPPLELDEYPDDPNAHKDTDGDGVADYYDINDFVDLSIDITIQKFKVTGRVDILKWAQVYFDVYIDDEKVKRIENNGKRWRVLLNQEKRISHNSISYDIPDTTKNPFTYIEIIMYDYDFYKEDDVIDISDKRGENTLLLKFDNVANTILYDGVTSGSQGILWYDITFRESDIPDTKMYNRSYRWNFNNKHWKISMDIPVDLYEIYVDYKIDRSPNSENAMTRFVTSDDEVINDLANELESLAESKDYNPVTTINFALRFVQVTMIYTLDNESKGKTEYWRFPVETLVEKQGDCEDTSVLFASIMDILDYDVALLYYTWEEDNKPVGHLAVGIHLEGNHGNYVEDDTGKKYYYCETTTPAYVIGELPKEIEDKTAKIIHI